MLLKFLLLAFVAATGLASTTNGKCKGPIPSSLPNRCEADCKGECTNICGDDDNCGGCGIVCGAGTKCFDSKCEPLVCASTSTCKKPVSCGASDGCYCGTRATGSGAGELVCGTTVCRGICDCGGHGCSSDADCNTAPGGVCVEKQCCDHNQCMYTAGC